MSRELVYICELGKGESTTTQNRNGLGASLSNQTCALIRRQ